MGSGIHDDMACNLESYLTRVWVGTSAVKGAPGWVDVEPHMLRGLNLLEAISTFNTSDVHFQFCTVNVTGKDGCDQPCLAPVLAISPLNNDSSGRGIREFACANGHWSPCSLYNTDFRSRLLTAFIDGRNRLEVPAAKPRGSGSTRPVGAAAARHKTCWMDKSTGPPSVVLDHLQVDPLLSAVVTPIDCNVSGAPGCERCLACRLSSCQITSTS